MSSDAKFCPHCGQKDTDGRITIGEFITAFFEAVFNIDSKLIRSIWNLFIPGKLTVEYFKGRHKSFAQPLRLFFVLAVIHFTIIGFVALDEIKFDFTPFNSIQNDQVRSELVNKIQEIEQSQADSVVNEVSVLDSLVEIINRDTTISDSSVIIFYYDQDSSKILTRPMDRNDAMNMNFEDLIVKYDVTQYISKVTLKQQIKFRKDPNSFTRFTLGNLVWMLLVMMPTLALFMKLLFIRRKRYFVEHLVFLFHWHSFAFLILSIFLLCLKWIDRSWTGAVIILILIFGYFALKRYYGQGFIKSLLKYVILLFVYAFLISVMLFITSAISFILF